MAELELVQGLKHAYVRVRENHRISYGGNQNWMEDRHLAKYGCGLVGMGDILLYLHRYGKVLSLPVDPAQLDRTKEGEILMDKKPYVKYLRELSRHYVPISRVLRGTTGIHLWLGFNLRAWLGHEPYRARWGVSSGKLYQAIKKMLQRDIPVLFSVGIRFPRIWSNRGVNLWSYHPVNSQLTRYTSTLKHYMVITGIVKDCAGQELLRISSWGQEYYIYWSEFEEYVKRKSLPFLSNILYIFEKT